MYKEIILSIYCKLSLTTSDNLDYIPLLLEKNKSGIYYHSPVKWNQKRTWFRKLIICAIRSSFVLIDRKPISITMGCKREILNYINYDSCKNTHMSNNLKEWKFGNVILGHDPWPFLGWTRGAI